MGLSSGTDRKRPPGRLAALLAACLPLVANAAEPRFQTLGIADLSDSRAVAVTDDGCAFVGNGGPAGDPAPFRFEHGTVRPVRNLLGSLTINSVAGISGDGRVVIGNGPAERGLRLEEDGIARVLRSTHDQPTRARAISGDGTAIIGDSWDCCGHEVIGIWRAIADFRPGVLGFGAAVALSGDGEVAVGWDDSSRQPRAAMWTTGTADSLGELPGDSSSRALGISADASTIVGHSGGRAVRWRAGAIEELGPGVAVAASADGSIVLGESFLWDAVNGRRDLRDAIEADFDVDLSDWDRLVGADLSADGQTIVGAAAWAGGPLRAFRARRASEPCPGPASPEVLPLLRYEFLDDPLGVLARPAVGADGSVYLSGYADLRVLKTRLRSGPDAPWSLDLVLELPEESDWLFVVAVGPDGSAYVSTSDEKLIRVGPQGVVELLDGSVYPKPVVDEGTEYEREIPTWATDIAFAPDGTMFVAAGARALRIDPDGEVAELFDLFDTQEWTRAPQLGLLRVQRYPDGRLVWGNGVDAVVTDASANLLEVLSDTAAFRVTESGGLFTSYYGEDLFYTSPEGVRGALELVTSDGTRWVTGDRQDLQLDGAGNLFFFATKEDWSSPHLMQLSADGELIRLYPGTPAFGAGADAVVIADWTDAVQIRTSPVPLACRNGFDDDGDGLADLADPGCSGELDASERSAGLACDNGQDDDGDGLADFPDDPDCVSRTSSAEVSECSDGVDNDDDGLVDWDGGGVGAPDPQCAGRPHGVERASCGLGFELALLALAARRFGRRRTRP